MNNKGTLRWLSLVLVLVGSLAFSSTKATALPPGPPDPPDCPVPDGIMATITADPGEVVFQGTKVTLRATVGLFSCDGTSRDISDSAEDVRWDFISGQSEVLENDYTLSPRFDANTVGEYRLRLSLKATYESEIDGRTKTVAVEKTISITVRPTGPTARFDWAMPDRFATGWDGNGAIDLNPPASIIQPKSWKVELNACPSDAGMFPIIGYAWKIGLPHGVEEIWTEPPQCRISFDFPTRGTYPVTLTVITTGGGSDSFAMDVVVKDLLIVSIGDSIASGEGNPVAPPKDGAPAFWGGPDGLRCHRSPYSGPAQAALAIERGDPHTSVTFVSVACSGAKIAQHSRDDSDKGGLLDPYGGIEGPKEPALPAQISHVAELVGDRKIDALLVTAGANDLSFAELVKYCAYVSDCGHFAQKTVTERLEELPGLYYRLDLALIPLPVSQVFITEYPDPTGDDNGYYCDMNFTGLPNPPGNLFGISDWYSIDPAESEWADLHVIRPLNKKIEEAAASEGWNFVGGIASEFYNHGYCAKDNWIVTYPESQSRQGNIDGTMHPNSRGHEVYKDRLVEAITNRLPIRSMASFRSSHDVPAGTAVERSLPPKIAARLKDLGVALQPGTVSFEPVSSQDYEVGAGSVKGLPSGLAFAADTGRLAGTVQADAGHKFEAHLFALDIRGGRVAELTITVKVAAATPLEVVAVTPSGTVHPSDPVATGTVQRVRPPARRAPARKLFGRTGPGRLLSLTSPSGARVKTLPAGVYTVVVRDATKADNFHLLGLGVNRKTGVRFQGTVTWKVAFAKGRLYRYRSDAHRTMRGSFHVVAKPASRPR